MHRNFSLVPAISTQLQAGFAGFAMLIAAASAQAQSNAVAGSVEVSVGAVIVSTPEYEGAKRRVSALAPDLNLSYKTQDWGTLSLGAKARGLSWTFVEAKGYSLGLALTSDQGRRAGQDGTVLRPGSKRLSGMGEIKSSAEFSVFGQATFGVPIGLRYTRNTGNGDVNAATLSKEGSGGARLELSLELGHQLSPTLTVYASPSLTWADNKHNQTFFGVSAAQAAKSGFKAYTAGSGFKDFSLSAGAQLSLDKQWGASANLALSRLRGDAANSPLVERKSATTLSAGLSYRF